MRAKTILGSVLKLFVVLFAVAAPVWASGPRWVSGPPYFGRDKQPLAWYTTHPLYFTDPGDLSASVSHAAADALVAQAAAVWNVPQTSLVLAQGGSLEEHVTGTAIAVNGSALQLPADAQSGNYLQKQIAVIYDTDGSVLDTLLGAGGSDPSGCLQNGVVESVDSFGQDATIRHAIVILNGRCTGPEPEKQLQMQYQLVRVFGRVLGVGWSQTNDNVFTQSPTPTHDQAMHWPVMHPIDVICGLYTYQCMPSPFQLRDDDISSLSQLYFIPQGAGAGMPGKQDTWTNGFQLQGEVFFPTHQGMEGVNVTVRRQAMFYPTAETWQTASSVTGFQYRHQFPTTLKGQDGSATESFGSYDPAIEGYYLMENVSVPAGAPWETIVIETEPVNPLYTGPYALSSSTADSATIAPSGSRQYMAPGLVSRNYIVWENFTPSDAVAACGASGGGGWGSPVGVPQSGWWNGVLCGVQNSLWESLPVKANRSLTMEVTALDETGSATAVKMMPAMGAWHSTDAWGIAPTVTSTPAALATGVVGMSAMTVENPTAGTLRLGTLDQRGLGRPDFGYQARVLYADAITPANVGATGGTVVITGMGFRAGNQVLVNGVQATVTNVSATAITASVPTLRALGSTKALLATVQVRDAVTGGVSTMTSALGYGSPQERLELVSAPAGQVVQELAAATAFAVQVVGTDGVTPVAGETVTFSVKLGYATFGVCGAVSCTVQTNAQGIASTTVTPATAGTVTLKASTPVLSVSASMTVVVRPDTITLLSAPASVATVGVPAESAFTVRVLAGDGVTARAGAAVTVSVTAGAARMESCAAAICSLVTDANGMASTRVTPLGAGTIGLEAVSAAGTLTASFTAATESMRLLSVPAGVVTVGSVASGAFAVQVVAADGVTPVAGEAVHFATTAGSAILIACGASSCDLVTDAGGMATTGVAPMSASAVTVAASSPAGMESATVTGQAKPDVLTVVTAPSGTLFVGDVATSGFAVRLLLADGVTAVVGQAVTFTVASGSATFGACGAASCTVSTDANGMAMTTVTAGAAGTAMLTASAAGATQAMAQTVPMIALARDRAVMATVPVEYVAEGCAVSWPAAVALSDNSAAIDGVAVRWTGGTGMSFAGGSSTAVGAVATMQASVAGLGAGVSVQGSACAWGGVCGTIAAQGVSATEWRVQVVSGAGQQVATGATVQPIVVRVVDAAGHPVAGAPVEVLQAATAWQQACPVLGRCTAPAVLGTGTTARISDAAGKVTITPIVAGDGAEVLAVTVAAGTQGTATLSLMVQP